MTRDEPLAWAKARALIEANWVTINRERGMLIDASIAGELDTAQRARLDVLQEFADEYLERMCPRPTQALDELKKRLEERPEATEIEGFN